MLAGTLRTLYGYNRWATQRLLEVAEQLTSEQLHTPGNAGHGSVHNTLLHLIDTQQSWLAWWDGSLSAEEAYRLTPGPGRFPRPRHSVRSLGESGESDPGFCL
jgi:uncharacterized damage-inducible protein DinB